MDHSYKSSQIGYYGKVVYQTWYIHHCMIRLYWLYLFEFLDCSIYFSIWLVQKIVFQFIRWNRQIYFDLVRENQRQNWWRFEKELIQESSFLRKLSNFWISAYSESVYISFDPWAINLLSYSLFKWTFVEKIDVHSNLWN